MFKERKNAIFISCLIILLLDFKVASAQGVEFNGYFSPAEGLTIPQERPYRNEICLNGKWEFQPVAVPESWVSGKGVAPDLPKPVKENWEDVKIKIPSPWNVNEWGGGSNVGPGTNLPYAPSSVYYPSYPAEWAGARMGWLKRNFTVPSDWTDKRVIIHFEAVAGECVVLVNGKELAGNFDSYLPFDVDITDHIKENGDNELLVGIRHRRLFDKTHPEYKYFSATYPAGSYTDDLIGIWQDVFLQAKPSLNVQSVFVKPDVAQDELTFDVELINQSKKNSHFKLSGEIKEWLNKSVEEGLAAPEIDWALGETALKVESPENIVLKPGETKKVVLKAKVNGKLKLWNPLNPNLYTLLLDIKANGETQDRIAQRFGWRSFTIQDKDFYLNGEKVQLFGDLQHPFGPYICSRRFAWAWYKMIKDVGGNAVRPHAQPWPRVYYDLADEMGLMVLDETALFGSSIRLNMEEDILWERSAEHLDRLILRDRNHPSVVGWSVGNELFAIALLNKPPDEVAKKWDKKIIELAKRPALLDPTRSFITSDGDKDMGGTLPVWSKHFGHGLHLEQLPEVNKPLVIGESGATYYGKPRELFPFVGLKAYESYYGRNEALAIDVYQNTVKMARPLLDWYSPSELCWFGIEHLNLGYHDSTRLPNINDGIFPGLPYEEGKPGYQFERIPPYVTTFNPGLDPKLPLYKPLPMFYAYQAALAKEGPLPSEWDHFQKNNVHKKPDYPTPVYQEAYLVGNDGGKLAKFLDTVGIKTSDKKRTKLIIIDGDNVSAGQLKAAKPVIKRAKKKGGLVWILVSGDSMSGSLGDLIPKSAELIEAPSTALKSNPENVVGKYFDLRSLYFSEMEGDRKILKYAINGDELKNVSVVFEAADTDWSLFNGISENRKNAQVVLYEYLQKPRRIAMMSYPLGEAVVEFSSLDYSIMNNQTLSFWRDLCKSMAINYEIPSEGKKKNSQKDHDLLLDGPIDDH